jgi:hypothetical protein
MINDVSDFASGVFAKFLKIGGIDHVVIDESNLRVLTFESDHLIPKEDVIYINVAMRHDMQVNFSLHVEICLVAVDYRSPLLFVLHCEKVS